MSFAHQIYTADGELTFCTDQQAIETLLSLAETYAGHASDVGNQSIGTVKGAHDDNSLRSAETDLRVR